MRTILFTIAIFLSAGCQTAQQTRLHVDASEKPADAGVKDASPDASDATKKDSQLVDPTDHPDFVGCQEAIMDFFGGVITIAVGLWVGQCLIDWWRKSGK